jgi:Fur family zinc uptake transcriptional regulator
VLEALLESHRAMTAYELLDRLAAAGLGRQPPVAYRALDFLVANGFAHRIERLSAFAACTGAGEAHAGAHRAGFLVCRGCRRVAETPLVRAPRALEREAAAIGFAIERTVFEAEGLCARCREEAA